MGKVFSNQENGNFVPNIPSGEKSIFIQIRDGTNVEIQIHEEHMTTGWLISQIIRQTGDQDIVAITTQTEKESVDYWLTQFERNLTPLRNNECLTAFYRQDALYEFPHKSTYVPVKTIGKGGYSFVHLVRHFETGDLYAMKIIQKDIIAMDGKGEQVMKEYSILKTTKSPFLVRIHSSFQSTNHIHFLMDFCPGGELFFHLHRLGRFSESVAKFYFGEICIALSHLHKENIIYRDLKPENVILDLDGHIRLIDFGLCKENMGHKDRTYSFCGSPEYMSPEMLLQSGHGRGVDFYQLGVLLYEMLTGVPPFYNANIDIMYRQIWQDEPKLPASLSHHAKHLLRTLLHKDPDRRMGSLRGVDEIKQHPWCNRVNWSKLAAREITPPVQPCLDQSNFHTDYTSIPIDANEYSDISVCEDAQFEGFEFVREDTSPWAPSIPKKTRSHRRGPSTTIERARSELPELTVSQSQIPRLDEEKDMKIPRHAGTIDTAELAKPEPQSMQSSPQRSTSNRDNYVVHRNSVAVLQLRDSPEGNPFYQLRRDSSIK